MNDKETTYFCGTFGVVSRLNNDGAKIYMYAVQHTK